MRVKFHKLESGGVVVGEILKVLAALGRFGKDDAAVIPDPPGILFSVHLKAVRRRAVLGLSVSISNCIKIIKDISWLVLEKGTNYIRLCGGGVSGGLGRTFV